MVCFLDNSRGVSGVFKKQPRFSPKFADRGLTLSNKKVKFLNTTKCLNDLGPPVSYGDEVLVVCWVPLYG